MDEAKPGCVEFLDLSGIEEQERTWILSSLHSWNPNIKLPWTEGDGNHFKGYEPTYLPQKCIGSNYNQPPLYAATVSSSASPGGGYEPTMPVPLNVQPANLIIANTTDKLEYEEKENSDLYGDMKAEESVHGFTNGVTAESGFDDDNNEYIAEETKISSEIEQNGSSKIDHITTPPLPPTPVAAPKSWASLFNKSGAAASESTIINKTTSHHQHQHRHRKEPILNDKSPGPFVGTALNNTNAGVHLKEPFQSNADDPNLHRMGEFLSSHAVDNRVTSLQPRGLINRSNYCYINSILQAMLACPPVYNLLGGLTENSAVTTEKKKITPIIDSVTRFIREFHHLPAGMRVGRRLDKNQKKDHSISLNCDTPFEPFWMHKLLSGMRTDTFVVEGRQEDAEEFLGCLLNGLNDEMLELMKLVGDHSRTTTTAAHNDGHYELNSSSSQDEDKEWQVMGPKNKGAVTRRMEFSRTPISDIFGGLLRSRLHRTGDQFTDNIQPFFTLQLNIEKASSVREALEALVLKNQLEGVTSSKTNEEVEAWQQVTIEELPIVLVLHLKCFDYKPDGCTKIVKPVEFPIDLKIDTKLLSSKMNYTSKEKQYKLFAVVYHEGKEATKGHYVTDSYHVGYASWLRYDDASVKAVPEEHVLKPHGTRVPYLLFYRRSDSLSKTNK